MQKINSGNAYSKHVLMCLDLIYDNIYNGIRVQELADKLGLTPQYLSKLFKQEVGVTISDYIMSRRIQAAENMLKFSEYSPIDIGNYMGFSSHSHFIACFKKHTGLTPKQFRENYFRQKQEVDKKAKEEKLYGPNRDAGIQFLKENAAKEGVITTASGLQYKVLVKGEGEVPQKTDKVLVNYEGRLVDGTVFDASAKHGDKPASFRADQVIKGWTEALTMMPVGSKWQLYIPQELAYGERNMGNIKPYSTLIFDVELVGIDKPKTAEPAKPAVSAKPATKKTAKK